MVSSLHLFSFSQSPNEKLYPTGYAGPPLAHQQPAFPSALLESGQMLWSIPAKWHMPERPGVSTFLFFLQKLLSCFDTLGNYRYL